MLSIDGNKFTIEIPLGRYNECRSLLEDLDVLETSYAAAANDAARIVILKQILNIYRKLIDIFLLERT